MDLPGDGVFRTVFRQPIRRILVCSADGGVFSPVLCRVTVKGEVFLGRFSGRGAEGGPIAVLRGHINGYMSGEGILSLRGRVLGKSEARSSLRAATACIRSVALGCRGIGDVFQGIFNKGTNSI